MESLRPILDYDVIGLRMNYYHLNFDYMFFFFSSNHNLNIIKMWLLYFMKVKQLGLRF